MAGKHFMNPAVGRHLEGAAKEGRSENLPPHIHVHPHSKGVTVHIMHHDGQHEKHEHEHGDAEGITSHIYDHHSGTGVGQDHGFSSGATEEDEMGYGSGV